MKIRTIMKPLLSRVPVILIVLLLFSCPDTRSQTTGENTILQDANIPSSEQTRAMIECLKPKGWKIQDEVEVYKPINLYEKINGRAEYYLSYDMVWAIFAEFRRGSDNRLPIKLTVFNMGNPTHAFGVFSGERSMGVPQLNIGRDSYCSKTGYYIWHGQYYIQVNASDTTGKIEQACLDLAHTLTEKLVDSGQPVAGLKILPSENLVSQSVQFFLVDALGHTFLKNTYTAKYAKGNMEIPVFLSCQDSPALAEEIITKFKGHVKKYGKGVDPVSVDDIEVLVCDMGRYYDVIFQKGSSIGGVAGLKDKTQAIAASIDFYKKLSIE